MWKWYKTHFHSQETSGHVRITRKDLVTKNGIKIKKWWTQAWRFWQLMVCAVLFVLMLPYQVLPLGRVYFHLCMYYISPPPSPPMHPLPIRVMYRCYLMICAASSQNNGLADCSSYIFTVTTIFHLCDFFCLHRPLLLWCLLMLGIEFWTNSEP